MDKDAAASGRPAKLQKLHDLRRGVPYVSKSALERILKTIQEKGLPEVVHAKAMLEAARKEMSSWNAYGSLLQTCKVINVHGAEQDLMFVNFHSLLHGLFKQGGSFTELFEKLPQSESIECCQPIFAGSIHGRMLARECTECKEQQEVLGIVLLFQRVRRTCAFFRRCMAVLDVPEDKLHRQTGRLHEPGLEEDLGLLHA